MSKPRHDPPALPKRTKERTVRRLPLHLEGDADGGPPSGQATFEPDAGTVEHQRVIAALRESLVALPVEAAPPDVWEEIERRRARTQPVDPQPSYALPVFYRRRYVLAGAAAVAVIVSVVGLYLIDPPAGGARARDTLPAVQVSEAAVSALVAESQRLERNLKFDRELLAGMTIAGPSDGRWRTSRHALVYRLSDLDDELTSVSLSAAENPARAEELWRRRVELMHSLGELDRAQKWQAYRAVVF